MTDPYLGRRLGNVVLDRKLGQGGMGVVYHGQHAALGSDVAVKILPHHLVSSPEYRERFFREARAAFSLRHPHIISVLDAGETDDQLCYLVMEFCGGRTLAHRLGESRLDVDEGLPLFHALLDALIVAHERNLVHRDIKPDNVIFDSDGVPRVADFGLARQLLLEASGITASGQALGTPAYMPIEQWEGVDIDGRVDQYALGVMFFECFTGDLPVVAATGPAVLAQLMAGQRALLSQRRPDLPPELVATVDRMTALRRDDRFPSLEQVKAALPPLPFNVHRCSGHIALRSVSGSRSALRPIGADAAGVAADRSDAGGPGNGPDPAMQQAASGDGGDRDTGGVIAPRDADTLLSLTPTPRTQRDRAAVSHDAPTVLQPGPSAATVKHASEASKPAVVPAVTARDHGAAATLPVIDPTPATAIVMSAPRTMGPPSPTDETPRARALPAVLVVAVVLACLLGVGIPIAIVNRGVGAAPGDNARSGCNANRLNDSNAANNSNGAAGNNNGTASANNAANANNDPATNNDPTTANPPTFLPPLPAPAAERAGTTIAFDDVRWPSDQQVLWRGFADAEGRLLDDAVLEAGEWEILQPVIVPAGRTLLIEAGATLRFHPDAGITVYGRITVRGTAEQPVRMSGFAVDGDAAARLDLAAGDHTALGEPPHHPWNGIMLLGVDATAEFTATLLEHGRGGLVHTVGLHSGNVTLPTRGGAPPEVIRTMGGGLMIVEGASATLKECLIRQCRPRGPTTSTYGYGGGVFVLGVAGAQARLDLRACTLAQNESRRGGALFAGIYADVDATDVLFESNGLYNPTGKAGAVALEGTDKSVSASFEGCRFNQNSASSRAGAIWTYRAVDLTIRDCVFDGNMAAEYAGAVSIEAEAQPSDIMRARLERVRFYANLSGEGGGVHAIGVATLTLVQCSFDSNHAPRGGAIAIDRRIDATLTDCRFSNNISTDRGGALSLFRGASVRLTGCGFVGNRANEGGAIGTNSFGTVLNTITMIGCLFRDHAALQGGTFRFKGASVRAERCRIDDSVAAGDGEAEGGAICMGGPGAAMADVEITRCEFTDCSAAGGRGGSICALGTHEPSSLRLVRCAFERCAAPVGSALWLDPRVIFERTSLADNGLDPEQVHFTE